MLEFLDNSQDHKDDILNFIHGRKQVYFYGTAKYWIGFSDNEPFCFVLSDETKLGEEHTVHDEHASKTGTTICLDFGIGNSAFLGKGLAAPTLRLFVEFYREQVDPKADTFFIDPDDKNPRATHVYEKTGFKEVGTFRPNKGAFQGHETRLMVLKFSPQC